MADPGKPVRSFRPVYVAALLAAPSVATLAMLWYFGLSLDDYVPAWPNDETVNYLQARAFATHGFGAGYFGVEEQTAPASFSRFGVHGPAFAVLYGALSWPLAGSYASAVYLNVAALTLALAAYCWLARPPNRTLVLLTVFFLTFWPFYPFAISWMQEAFHYSLAVLLAGLFAARLRDAFPNRGGLLFGVTLAVVCAASLVRISWAALLLPLFLLNRPKPTPAATLLALAAGGVTTLACMKAFQMICAPFTAVPSAFLMNKLFTGGIGVEHYLEHLGRNLRFFAVYFEDRHWSAVDVLVQTALLLAVVAAAAARRGVRRLRGGPVPEPGAGRWLGFVGYNQAAIVMTTFFLYYVGNGGAPRIFSIHLLLGLLVACVAPLPSLRALLPAALVLNLAVTVPELAPLGDLWALRFTGPARVNAFRAKVARLMPFDPRGDGWANTVFSDRLPPEFAGLPPGIGVEYYLDRRALLRPVRSRYIIAVPGDIVLLRQRVRLLTTLHGLEGELYRHPDGGEPNLYLNLEPPGGEARPKTKGGR